MSGESGYAMQFSVGATGLVSGNTVDGIHTVRNDILAALLLESGSDPHVTNNIFCGPFRNAVYCTDQSRGTFVGNLLEGFIRYGFVLMAKAKPTCEGNTIHAYGARGAFAEPDNASVHSSIKLASMSEENIVLYENPSTSHSIV